MKPFEENLEYLRHRMIKEQLLGRDISDKKVLDVFDRIPRHKFIDPGMSLDAYGDFPISIGYGQTISQPYIVALMVQLLGVVKSEKVLEIGTGSGYETAILAELAERVYSVERMEPLARRSERILKELGYENIYIKVDDGTLGWQDFAPFDKIVVTASSPEVPQALLEQLSGRGRMVIPVGPRFSQRLILVEKSADGKVDEKDICGCVFVPLIGKYGWKKDAPGKDI